MHQRKHVFVPHELYLGREVLVPVPEAEAGAETPEYIDTACGISLSRESPSRTIEGFFMRSVCPVSSASCFVKKPDGATDVNAPVRADRLPRFTYSPDGLTGDGEYVSMSKIVIASEAVNHFVFLQ